MDQTISEEFERRWNVSHACGALDGTHIVRTRPRPEYKTVLVGRYIKGKPPIG